MKNYLKSSLLSVVLVTAFILSSCTKTVTGPAGPQGQPGTPGANGTSGTNGTNGTNGNANIQVYDFTVPAGGWQNTGSGSTVTGTNAFYYNYGVSINASAAVMVYLEDINNGIYTALPWTLSNAEYGFYYNTTSVTVIINSATGTSTLSLPNAAFVYKVVVIPPASFNMMKGIDTKNYTQLARAFGIN